MDSVLSLLQYDQSVVPENLSYCLHGLIQYFCLSKTFINKCVFKAEQKFSYLLELKV